MDVNLELLRYIPWGEMDLARATINHRTLVFLCTNTDTVSMFGTTTTRCDPFRTQEDDRDPADAYWEFAALLELGGFVAPLLMKTVRGHVGTTGNPQAYLPQGGSKIISSHEKPGIPGGALAQQALHKVVFHRTQERVPDDLNMDIAVFKVAD